MANTKRIVFQLLLVMILREWATASVHLLYNKKFLASTYSIPNLGPRPDTDKLKFRGADLKVPGIPLLKMLPDPPCHSHRPAAKRIKERFRTCRRCISQFKGWKFNLTPGYSLVDSRSLIGVNVTDLISRWVVTYIVTNLCTCFCEGRSKTSALVDGTSSLGRYVFGSEISYNKPPPACLG